MEFIINTDGSCMDNGYKTARAGWSYLVTDEKANFVQATTGKVLGNQDSNRGELTAFIKALEFAKSEHDFDERKRFVIRTDFELNHRLFLRISNPKKNNDLTSVIFKLLDECHGFVHVEKVESHTSKNGMVSYMNFLCDKLAKKAAFN